MKKLKLKQLDVQSFVTKLDGEVPNTVKGGTGPKQDPLSLNSCPSNCCVSIFCGTGCDCLTCFTVCDGNC